MNNPKEFKVFRSIQIALLGEIGPALRSVNVAYTDKVIHFIAYFDGEISEEDEEAMEYVETEILALFSDEHEITHESIRLDYPAKLPQVGACVYRRREFYID